MHKNMHHVVKISMSEVRTMTMLSSVEHGSKDEMMRKNSKNLLDVVEHSEQCCFCLLVVPMIM